MFYQKELINRMNAAIPPDQSLSHILCDLLNMSMDSIYRRLNYKTPFNFDESLIIAEHFNISLDSLKGLNSMSAIVNFKQLDSNIDCFKDYLIDILRNVELIYNNEGSRLIYSALDIPIFQNLGLSHIGPFKMFYWMHSIMNVVEYQGKSFERGIIDSELLELGQRIYEVYNGISATEIWTTNTLNSTLRQIEFYYQSGLIKDVEVLSDLYTDLEGLIDKQEVRAERGTKLIDHLTKDTDDYQLYVSDIELSNNGAIAIVNGQKISFIGHLTFNTLSSYHFQLNEMTYGWYERIIEKSTLISKVAVKQRYQFFHHLRKQVSESRERVQV